MSVVQNSDVLVLSLLVIAVVLGFLLGLWQAKRKQQDDSAALPWPQQRYYQGLTQLLNDQPDAAIETFIAALEVNSETLETHLALGNLLRKRGEVSRAIRVHQNLLARPSLSRKQMHFAQLELAVDYMRAGLLDRAENLFKELIDVRDIEKDTRIQASQYLLDVYQELREWLLAIDVADRLTTKKFSTSADEWRSKQAQFSCEVADAAIEEKDWLTARRWLRTAARYDKNCARASLLLANLEMAQGDYDQAVAALRKVKQQDARFASEILAPMFECYKRINNLKDLQKELSVLYAEQPELLTLRYLAKAKESVEGGEAVVSLLMQELPNYPRMEAAGELLKLVAEGSLPSANDSPEASLSRNPSSRYGSPRHYARIKSVLEKFTETRQQYLCEHCGFEGTQLHWQCPGCKQWATIALVPKTPQNARGKTLWASA